MVKAVLEKAGFTEGVTFKQTRFMKVPKETFAVYLDSYEARGSDDLNMIKDHSATIEMYAYKPDPAKEKAIETALDAYAINYNKQDRQWLDSEQMYLTVYDFDYITKGVD